jgi:hypothetical protein
MNERLRRDYRETEIPKAACYRARDRAWRRVVARQRRSWRPAWAPVGACALAAAVLAALLWPPVAHWLSDSRPAPAPSPAPAAVAVRGSSPQASQAPGAVSPAVRRSPEAPTIAAAPARLERVAHPPRLATGVEKSAGSPPQQQKLVVNFTLPRTGVRMIWILDKDFGKPTEAHNE